MNATNDSAKCAMENPNYTTKVLAITGFSVVLLFSVLGNSLLIRVVLYDKEARRKFPFNYLIVNMAIADILNALSAALVFIAFLTVGRLWLSGTFGLITCKISYSLVVTSVAASIFTVATMGLDRFMAVHATIRPLSQKGIRCAIVIIWMLAVVSGIPNLYKMTINHKPDGKHYCNYGKWHEDAKKHFRFLEIEEMTKFVVLYMLPLTFMVFFYAIITWKIRERSKLPVGNNRRCKIVQQNQRVVRMIIAIVIIFAVCWLPVHVNHLLRSFSKSTYCRLPAFLLMSFFWLAHANCAINPWIWFLFTAHFRAQLKRVFKTNLSLGKIQSDHVPLSPKLASSK